MVERLRELLSKGVFSKNGPTPASFSFIFGLFKQTIQFLQQINVIKCPSSIQRWDLNPQPFEHDSSPINTRPGLPPLGKIAWWQFSPFHSLQQSNDPFCELWYS